MKKLITLLLITLSVNCFSQPIYEGLNYGMTKSQAKKEFKANKELYDNVDLGNGFVWRLWPKNFFYENNKLIGFNFIPAKYPGGTTHQNTINFLEFTRQFFESKGYIVFFEPDAWQYPESFNSRYGLILISPDKKNTVQLYPVKLFLMGNISYQPIIKILNHDWFMNDFEKQHEAVEEKQESTGF